MGWYTYPKEYPQKPCSICGKPVKPGDKFYFIPEGTGVEHAVCAWTESETMAKPETTK